uniref:Uncharacterized protein n=1 Tax=Opuntia streptacantha TaxID=393608 RepID=A0A7C8YEP9_OPUST
MPLKITRHFHLYCGHPKAQCIPNSLPRVCKLCPSCWAYVMHVTVTLSPIPSYVIRILYSPKHHIKRSAIQHMYGNKKFRSRNKKSSQRWHGLKPRKNPCQTFPPRLSDMTYT